MLRKGQTEKISANKLRNNQILNIKHFLSVSKQIYLNLKEVINDSKEKMSAVGMGTCQVADLR